MKNLNQIDLNLLVYLEVLLRERNVTQAANQLGLSQPAMSNGLRRLRALFDDPLLVRTSEGMTPTERALELEPLVKDILLGVDRAMQPATEFEPRAAQMVVRIMASDYAESTLFPAVLTELRENAPDITEVSFLLGPSSDANEAFIHVELDRIQTAPRFRQMDGAGLALFDASASSVVCTMNTCTIDWAFKSTWLLDDVDDLHVLTTATDDEGLAAGPEVFVRKTAFNEVENDLEVVEFTVTDSQQRRIDDWTNSFWPFHLDENETLLASGRVRMEGIANQWVEAGEAEATVTLRAVPPKNLSGGPDEWPGEPVSWSRSWTAEVESGGWFSVQTSTPTDEDGVPSNTFLELVPSLSRRGPVGLNASSSEDRTVVLTPTRLLFDTVQPTVNTLTVLDSGQEVPADGHVAMYGKDIALRLQISDPEGLASLLEVWTWLEKLHDTNNNGLMEADEYRMETVSLNRGVAELEVDLPLLSSESVVPDGANAGRLSIVLVGEDLAGNTLVGGGTFGEANDLATLSVQRRADTTVDVDNIGLDAVQGRLLAGHQHEFAFTLGDAN